ncbi:MAG: hypothetical protein RLZZ387_4519 [Chloroflexota bacterium]|jgi:hypothetical protein
MEKRTDGARSLWAIALKGQPVNTRISYRYADRRDCRQYTSVIVAGTITWEQIGPHLATKRSFVPGQLGLEDLQYRFKLPGVDHSWHLIAPDDIKPTDDAPTIVLTGDELAKRFADTPWDGDWFVNGLPRHIDAPPAPFDPVPSVYAPPPPPSAWPKRPRARKAGAA